MSNELTSEDKYWLGVLSIIGICFVTLVIGIVSYNMTYDSKVKALVDSGIDPIAVNCALQDSMGKFPTCVALASKGVK